MFSIAPTVILDEYTERSVYSSGGMPSQIGPNGLSFTVPSEDVVFEGDQPGDRQFRIIESIILTVQNAEMLAIQDPSCRQMTLTAPPLMLMIARRYALMSGVFQESDLTFQVPANYPKDKPLPKEHQVDAYIDTHFSEYFDGTKQQMQTNDGQEYLTQARSLVPAH